MEVTSVFPGNADFPLKISENISKNICFPLKLAVIFNKITGLFGNYDIAVCHQITFMKWYCAVPVKLFLTRLISTMSIHLSSGRNARFIILVCKNCIQMLFAWNNSIGQRKSRGQQQYNSDSLETLVYRPNNIFQNVLTSWVSFL